MPSGSSSGNHLLFSLDDYSSADLHDTSPQEAPPPFHRTTSSGSTQTFAPKLKSTTSSREAQFEADSDDLSDSDLTATNNASSPLHRPAGEPGAPRARRPSPSVPSVPPINRIRGASLDGIGNDLRQFRQSVERAVGVPGWDGEGLPDWLKRGAGVFDGTVNMANSILGAGIVGLPYSMRESGFFAGLGLLIGLSFLTDWTIRLIVLNAKLSGRNTYIEIMEHCFGGNGKASVSIFQFAFAFGGMCAFCVVIGDTIPHVITFVFPSLTGTLLANRQFVIAFCTLTISYPLSLYRNIESLSRASFIALVSMIVIIVTVVVRGPAVPVELKGDPALRFTIINPVNIVRSIAVISFAFVCHHNSLLIYGSLKEPSMDKFGKVTHYSTTIAAVAAITMSVAGYWSFEDKTLGNILNNFPEDDTLVNIARFCFGVNMFTTFPLEAFVCREVLETYFFAGEFDQTRHIYFTTSLVVSALFVSLFTCDLGIVLELTGGLSATTLAFIFPSICYLKLSSDSSKVLPPSSIPTLTSTSSSLLRRANGDVNHPNGEREEEDGEDELEDLEGGGVDVDEVELPLRPGANLRHRPPSAAGRKWYQSTRPLAIACAAFGIVVLVVSVGTALSDAASGRAGAVHQC